MTEYRLIEFATMLLIEKKAQEDLEFYNYLLANSDKDAFNNRYKELLDEFLNQYALNNTEKSE